MKKRIVFLIYAIIEIIIAFLFCIAKKIFAAENAQEVFRILSDAFLVPAVLYIGISLLGLISTKGVYDIFGFGTGSLLGRFNPMQEKEKYRSFYDYKMAKDEKGRKWKPEMLLSGLAALGVSVVFLVIYSVV